MFPFSHAPLDVLLPAKSHEPVTAPMMLANWRQPLGSFQFQPVSTCVFNDLGFLNGADVVKKHVLTGWIWNDPKGCRQFASIMGAVTGSWDFAGNNTSKGAWLNGNIEQRNHWSWNGSTFYSGPSFNARKTRGGPLMVSKPGESLSLYFD